MPSDVTFKHPEYVEHKDQLDIVNNVYDGIDTAVQHLIPLRNESQTLFTDRRGEATLDNFVERITTAMAGQINRKSIAFTDISNNITEAMENIAGENNLNQFAKNITETAIRDGKTFVLVDIPMNGGEPYFSNVLRSQVTNWKKDEEGFYTLVVIKEAYSIPDGRFGFDTEVQYRVIDENGNVEIWRSTEAGWYIAEYIETSYDFCPFYCIDVDTIPPLYDIARINLKHMNFTSLRDRFLREALDPILFGQNLGIDDGGDENNPTIIIGVNQMMNTDNPDSNLTWVELDGKNYEISERHLMKLEEDMASRALNLQSEANIKTATQVSEENSESTSRLSDVADDLESTLNKALNALSMMKYNKPLTGRAEVNRDFNSATPDSNTLTALNTLEVSGNITKRTLLQAVNETDFVEIEDIDEELRELEQIAIDREAQINDGMGTKSTQQGTAD